MSSLSRLSPDTTRKMLYPKVTERSRAGIARSRTPHPVRRRVALVTGSSRGVGCAIAQRLARDGLAVAVNDGADAEQAQGVVGAIRRDGGIAEAFTGDVADADQVAELAAAVAGSLGPVDVLVLNAAGPRPHVPLADVAWALRRALLPAMKASGSGRIVKVDPEVLDSARPGMTRSWAWELAPLGITVNTVAPRFVAPHGAVAHVVSFVASPDADHITGQRIVVDGGRGPVG